MQSQAKKLLRHMGLYLLRVQSFHHAPVQIQSMQRQSIHRVRHVEGMHMASDDQSIMMFPVPLHQRQEAASPFYMNTSLVHLPCTVIWSWSCRPSSSSYLQAAAGTKMAECSGGDDDGGDDPEKNRTGYDVARESTSDAPR